MKLGLTLDTSLPDHSVWSDVLFDNLQRALLSNGSGALEDGLNEIDFNDVSSSASSSNVDRATSAASGGSGELSVSLLVRIALRAMERYMVISIHANPETSTRGLTGSPAAPMTTRHITCAREELQAAFTSLVAPNNPIVALFSKRIGKALLMILVASQGGTSANSNGANVGATSAPVVMQTGINVSSPPMHNATPSPSRMIGRESTAALQPSVNSLVGLIESSKLAAMSLQSKPQVCVHAAMYINPYEQVFALPSICTYIHIIGDRCALHICLYVYVSHPIYSAMHWIGWLPCSAECLT